MANAPHQFFTVSTTAYQRALDHETRNGECFAVHYEPAPQKVEGGTSYGLIFPLLLVTAYAKEPRAIAERVAQILEKHWNDEEKSNGQHDGVPA